MNETHIEKALEKRQEGKGKEALLYVLAYKDDIKEVVIRSIRSYLANFEYPTNEEGLLMLEDYELYALVLGSSSGYCIGQTVGGY